MKSVAENEFAAVPLGRVLSALPKSFTPAAILSDRIAVESRIAPVNTVEVTTTYLLRLKPSELLPVTNFMRASTSLWRKSTKNAAPGLPGGAALSNLCSHSDSSAEFSSLTIPLIAVTASTNLSRTRFGNLSLSKAFSDATSQTRKVRYRCDNASRTEAAIIGGSIPSRLANSPLVGIDRPTITKIGVSRMKLRASPWWSITTNSFQSDKSGKTIRSVESTSGENEYVNAHLPPTAKPPTRNAGQTIQNKQRYRGDERD